MTDADACAPDDVARAREDLERALWLWVHEIEVEEYPRGDVGEWVRAATVGADDARWGWMESGEAVLVSDPAGSDQRLLLVAHPAGAEAVQALAHPVPAADEMRRLVDVLTGRDEAWLSEEWRPPADETGNA